MVCGLTAGADLISGIPVRESGKRNIAGEFCNDGKGRHPAWGGRGIIWSWETLPFPEREEKTSPHTGMPQGNFASTEAEAREKGTPTATLVICKRRWLIGETGIKKVSASQSYINKALRLPRKNMKEKRPQVFSTCGRVFQSGFFPKKLRSFLSITFLKAHRMDFRNRFDF